MKAQTVRCASSVGAFSNLHRAVRGVGEETETSAAPSEGDVPHLYGGEEATRTDCIGVGGIQTGGVPLRRGRGRLVSSPTPRTARWRFDFPRTLLGRKTAAFPSGTVPRPM